MKTTEFELGEPGGADVLWRLKVRPEEVDRLHDCPVRCDRTHGSQSGCSCRALRMGQERPHDVVGVLELLPLLDGEGLQHQEGEEVCDLCCHLPTAGLIERIPVQFDPNTVAWNQLDASDGECIEVARAADRFAGLPPRYVALVNRTEKLQDDRDAVDIPGPAPLLVVVGQPKSQAGDLALKLGIRLLVLFIDENADPDVQIDRSDGGQK